MSSLKKFLYWLLSGIFICFVGISNCFADTLTPYSSFSSGSLSGANQFRWYNQDAGLWNNTNLGTTVNFNTSRITFWSNITLDTTKVYTIDINFKDYDLLPTFDSSMVKVWGCSQLLCQDSFTIVSVVKSNSTSNSNKLTIKFVPTSNSPAFQIHLGNTNYAGIPITGVSTFGINSITYTSQTSDNTDILIDNANNNAQNIIDNQNSNSQEIKDTIKDSLNSCRSSYNLLNLTSTFAPSQVSGNFKSIVINGNVPNNVAFDIGTAVLSSSETYYFSFNNNSSLFNSYVITLNGNNQHIYFTSDKSFSVSSNGTYTFSMILIANTYNNLIIKPMINLGTSPKSWEEYGIEICNNKIDDTNNKIDNLTDTLTDTNVNTSSLNNVAGWLPPGPLDSVLNLPLTFFNTLNNALSQTCSPLNITVPFINSQISIPCLSTIFNQITGVPSLWSWVGAISSVIILYNYLLGLYAWVDSVLELRLNMYQDFGGDPANFG